jgi:hypothetical protein
MDDVLRQARVGVRERDLPLTLDGVTLGPSDIVVRRALGKKRRRFVLAHELGHVLVRRGLAPWVTERSEEKWADEFALELLVGSTKLAEVADVARRKKVEPRVAAWALCRSGALPEVVILGKGLVVCRTCGFRHRGGGCVCNRDRVGIPAAC